MRSLTLSIAFDDDLTPIVDIEITDTPDPTDVEQPPSDWAWIGGQSVGDGQSAFQSVLPCPPLHDIVSDYVARLPLDARHAMQAGLASATDGELLDMYGPTLSALCPGAPLRSILRELRRHLT